jgi:hypothetical protein
MEANMAHQYGCDNVKDLVKKQRIMRKINKKANELFDLIREHGEMLDRSARSKLKTDLIAFENAICKKCSYKNVWYPFRLKYCRKKCRNYKDYGGKKQYWRILWKRITGKKN